MKSHDLRVATPHRDEFDDFRVECFAMILREYLASYGWFFHIIESLF